MSIDAVINKVSQEGDDLVLDLMSREVSGLRGQPILTIKNFSHVPQAGQVIWGGSSICIIEPGCGVSEPQIYQREGYTKLREKDTARKVRYD